MATTERPPAPPSITPARRLRLEADLAKARLRRERLEHDAGFCGPEYEAEVAAKMADADATIGEIEEAIGGPAAQQPAAVPSNDSGAPQSEYLDTRDAAAVLGISPRTLEGLRARGEGPPHIRVGRAVRYRREDLRRSAK